MYVCRWRILVWSYCSNVNLVEGAGTESCDRGRVSLEMATEYHLRAHGRDIEHSNVTLGGTCQ